MKKLLFFGIILTTLFSSCKKNDETVYQSYFWTSVDTSMVKMSIYVDDNNMGQIQYLENVPDCCKDSAFKKLTPVPLKIGVYHFVAKDQKENTRFSAKVEILKGGAVVVNHLKGKLDIYGFDDSLAFGISY